MKILKIIIGAIFILTGIIAGFSSFAIGAFVLADGDSIVTGLILFIAVPCFCAVLGVLGFNMLDSFKMKGYHEFPYS